VASYLFPELFRDDIRKDYVAVNVAYDRAELRFGNGYARFLQQMAELIRNLSKRVEVRYFAHTVVDEQFLFDVAREEGLSLQCDRLYDLDEAGIIRKYREPRMAIGMRGHAGMIPFGCHTPIISLITHEKLRYFLEDVDMRECGICVRNADFSEPLLELAERMLSAHAEEVCRIEQQSERLWHMTVANTRRIWGSIGR
jgi:hypothetical protein